jgi:hypothetical protein
METSQVRSLRERIDCLEEEIRQMRDILMPPDNPFLGRFGLSPQQATIINALYKNNGELPTKRIDQLMIAHSPQAQTLWCVYCSSQRLWIQNKPRG